MAALRDDELAGLKSANAVLRAERDAALAREAALTEELAARTAELARRDSEYGEALEQQVATADVLQVINASPGDLAPAFDAVLERAMRLCEAAFGSLYTYDGERFHSAAQHGVPPAYAAYRAENPPLPTPVGGPATVLETRRPLQILDLKAHENYRRGNPGVRAMVDLGGVRSILTVPLIKDDVFLGIITVYRQEVRSFSDRQIALLESFAAQAVIAMENARLLTETREALDQQTATAEVLRVINESRGDLGPVFDIIGAKAIKLCDAAFGGIMLPDREGFRAVALGGVPEAYAEFCRTSHDYGRPTPGSMSAQFLAGAEVVHTTDVADTDGYRSNRPATRALVDLGGGRTLLGVALRKGTELLGMITIYRQEVRPFSDRQIELLRGFAAQAVIAIENARLLTETREALEQQTATAEVLQVINASPGDLAPVFDAILEKAHALCGAAHGALMTYDGEFFHTAALHDMAEPLASWLREPIPSVPGDVRERLLHGERLIHIADIAASETRSPERQAALDAGVRTLLIVPLRKDDVLLGYITANRREVRPFSGKQIALLQNFAAQAVIAIENARLITETREALEQQTATAEVLGVINSSPGNLVPVFDAILEKAHALCCAPLGSLVLCDGELLRAVATRGYPQEYEALARQGFSPIPPFRLLLSGEPFVHVLDTMTGPVAPDEEDPMRCAAVGIAGVRTALFVPLRKDATLLGYISAQRQEVHAFSDKQIALLQNFAAQAVIAIENARLLTETREALEQQTATAEVLQVINASPGSLAPVFETILEKAHSLCGATKGAFLAFDGEHFQVAATRGLSDAYTAILRGHRQAHAGYAVDEPSPREQLLNGADLVHLAGSAVAIGPIGRAVVEIEKIGAVLFVPLRRDRALLGYITAYRREEALFSDKQIVLLQNFAAQAVIAMENARLLTETREALEQQTATAEVLQVINASPGDLAPVFNTMLEKAMRLCEAKLGFLSTYDGQFFDAVAMYGVPEAYASEYFVKPYLPAPGTTHDLIVNGEDVVHITDLTTDPLDNPRRRAVIEMLGIRTILGLALRKEGELIGALHVYRQEVRPFSDKQIALLQNFAAQAVIAMENARLLTETREALEQQTATAEILGVINASPGDLGPVFDTMLDKALDLCGAAFGNLWTYDGQDFHPAAVRRVPRPYADALSRGPVPGTRRSGTVLGQIAAGSAWAQVLDAAAEDAYLDSRARAVVELGHARTVAGVALRKEGGLVGAITVYRQEVRPFSDKQIALLESFAAQAVVAMENARLLTELRQRTEELARRNSEYGERIEHQSATIDVLKAMSASPGDKKPVFDLIVRRAVELCNAESGGLFEYDGNLVTIGTIHGLYEHDGEMVHVESLDGTELDIAPSSLESYLRQFPMPPKRGSISMRSILDNQTIHIRDMRAEVDLLDDVRRLGHQSQVSVPLRHQSRAVGVITMAAHEPGGFSDSQIALLQTFAEQAVIAITSAETYRELQERTAALARRNSEYGERIEQQTATIDVLEAMSASSGDAQPVFQVIVERARAFCNADNANLALVEGGMLHLQASTIGSGATAIAAAARASYKAQFPRPVDATSLFGRAILARDAVQAPDVRADPQHFTTTTSGVVVRALVAVPLLRAGAPIGAILLARNMPGEFSATQVELLRTFAEQAVIAISSAETFKELQRRTADLTRSVAELQALEEVLRAVNSSLELETVLSTIISRAVQLSDADEGTIYEFEDAAQVFVPKSAYGMTRERVAVLRDRRIRIGDETPLGKCAAMRAPLHISDLTQTVDIERPHELVEDGIHALLAVPLLRDGKVMGGLVIRRRAVGGFAPTVPTLLQTFAGQSVLAIENARLFQEARQARVEAETTLADLRRTQDRLVQSEKMASLGQLTAGIAHEIKNPLNFVNNFSELSVDLLDELREAVAPDRLAVADGLRAEIDELTATLKGNLAKIAEHGRRADSIVKNMLLHSRSGPGEHRRIDLNSTVEEALNLAYHGARAATPGFNITMEKRLDPQAGMVDMYPQEITRVLLNLIGNGFYAAHQRAEAAGSNGFEPTLWLTTRDLGDQVEIRVRDNGTGISEAARDRIFEPFFTTKPAGEGTGLGLSLSYEIIVQQHGGRLTVDSERDAFTEFVVTLPRKLAATNGGQA
jgi:two-component system, NtrC family, sensor kinase